MGIDVSKWLGESPSERDCGSAETRGNPEDDGPVEIDERLGRLLPGEAQDTGTRQGDTARTTFQLSPDAIRLFGRLSDRLDKSQKDLLGDALRLSRRALDENPEQVRAAAARYEEVDAKTKTMAIAPETRSGLNDLAEEAGLPRDHVVELGIRLVKLSLEEAIRRKIGPHEDILEDLKDLCAAAEEVQIALTSHPNRDQAGGYEDPVEQGLFDILGALRSMAEAIEEELESRAPIEEDRQFV
jgi:hypothetical protein